MNYKTMTLEQIKARCAERDVKFSEIAEGAGVQPCFVTSVAKGVGTSIKVANAFSICMDVPRNLIFGKKYEGNHRRGPKDRTVRRNQVVAAVRSGTPLPKTTEKEGSDDNA